VSYSETHEKFWDLVDDEVQAARRAMLLRFVYEQCDPKGWDGRRHVEEPVPVQEELEEELVVFNTCTGNHTFGACDRDDCDFIGGIPLEPGEPAVAAG